MGDDLAASNVNRTYSLSAMSVAIVTFMLIFLYPRYANDEVNPVLFQVTLVVMAGATFSLVFAAFHYYAASLGHRADEVALAQLGRRADRFWLLGYSLLFLAPGLVLLTVDPLFVGGVWLVLWLAYLVFALRIFPRVQAGP